MIPTFVRYESLLLLNYDKTTDSYHLMEDSGRSFPYEFYEDLAFDGQDYYALYLDTKDRYPTISSDVWIDMRDVLSFLSAKDSSTQEGKKQNEKLYMLLKQYIAL